VGSGDNDNLKLYITRPERNGDKRKYCQKCGAVRIDQQLGLEPTPNEYVDNLVRVFREVRRVLKDDGVVWLNLGDSYASMKSRYNQKAQSLNGGKAQDNVFQGNKTDLYHHKELGLKDKDLIGIPWMVAFALRDDGWWLRQDIIWSKGNPMPESVKDRCTKSHEYVFLLAKNARYYFDSETLKEPSTTCGRGGISNKSHSKRCGMGLESSKDYMPSGTRNKRDVWTVNTQPYSGAHFAVMPEKLVEPCVLAGSRPGDTVLDPFNGAGTVGVVATRLGRSYIGIELNPEYIELSKQRINGLQMEMDAIQRA